MLGYRDRLGAKITIWLPSRLEYSLLGRETTLGQTLLLNNGGQLKAALSPFHLLCLAPSLSYQSPSFPGRVKHKEDRGQLVMSLKNELASTQLPN